MTDTVYYDAVRRTVARLKVLNGDLASGDTSRLGEFNALSEVTAKLLVPLFKDLAKLDMLVLWTKAVEGQVSDVSNLEVTGINGGGIQLSVKEPPGEEPVAEGEEPVAEGEDGLVLTEVTDPHDPAYNHDPNIRVFSFDPFEAAGC